MTGGVQLGVVVVLIHLEGDGDGKEVSEGNEVFERCDGV